MSPTPRNPLSKERSRTATYRSLPMRKRGMPARPLTLIVAVCVAFGLTTTQVNAQTGCMVERVSLSDTGAEATLMSNYDPSVSATGTMVAFASDAPNLVPGDGNGARDVFVRDLAGNNTIRVSVGVVPATGARIEADGFSSLPYMTPDGRFVAFYSMATNLVPPLVATPGQIYVHDRDTDADGILDELGPGEATTVMVSVDPGGIEATGGVLGEPFGRPLITPDARYVVFSSAAGNLDPGSDTNGTLDVFAHDRDLDANGVLDEPGGIATAAVSVSATTPTTLPGGISFGPAIVNPAIPTFGFFVAFTTSAPLDPADTNMDFDVYVADITAMPFVPFPLSVSPFGADGDGPSNEPPWITPDGRFVVYSSLAANLVPGDTNDAYDVFVFDFAAGMNTRVSVTDAGGEIAAGGTVGHLASISDNGQFVAFTTIQDDLVPDLANNGATDIFRHNRDRDGNGTYDEVGLTVNEQISRSFAGGPTNGFSGFNSISANGMFVAFASDATNLVRDDGNGTRDMFVVDPSIQPYMIQQQPADLAVCEGDPAVFTTAVQAGAQATYRWRKDMIDLADGDNISGSGTANLVIDPVTQADGLPAAYSCVVTSNCGTLTSTSATLTVLTGPAITQEPDSQEICEGDSAVFTVSASGSPTLDYQWFKDGQAIPGANNTSYLVTNATDADAAAYDVLVMNPCGGAFSQPAFLAVWQVGTGDTNGDTKRDGLDIQPFLDALLTPQQATQQALCEGDMDDNDTVDMNDVDSFIQALLAG